MLFVGILALSTKINDKNFTSKVVKRVLKILSPGTTMCALLEAEILEEIGIAVVNDSQKKKNKSRIKPLTLCIIFTFFSSRIFNYRCRKSFLHWRNNFINFGSRGDKKLPSERAGEKLPHTRYHLLCK